MTLITDCVKHENFYIRLRLLIQLLSSFRIHAVLSTDQKAVASSYPEAWLP